MPYPLIFVDPKKVAGLVTNHNETDLNLLIENINKICVIEGKTQFNKKDMTVSIPADQLDNFSEGDNKDGLAFKVNFSLLELKK